MCPPRPILFVVGDRAHSKFISENAYTAAREAGNQVDKSELYDSFCKGCLACQKTLRCVIHDDADTIAQKMLTADVIVFATPIYYYEMCGQMKTMLDRGNSLYTSDYAFRDIYLLSSAAEDEEGVDERAIHGLEGWIACYPKAHLAGVVFAGGVSEAGEIDGHPSLKKAYDMGLAIK